MTEEILNNIKKICSVPNVENVDCDENRKHVEVHFKQSDNNLIKELKQKISEYLATINLEISGYQDYFDNWENYNVSEKEWEKSHPRPQDPRYDPNGGLSREWQKRSYYDRTKGKGAREFEAYKAAHIEWMTELKNAQETGEIVPRHLPGFLFGIAELGYTDKVLSFYNSLKYKGD